MYTPLHAACASGQISVVKMLLDMEVEVNAVNAYGNTSLHIACLNGQDVVVGELLAFNASIDVVNHAGQVCQINQYTNKLLLANTVVSVIL